MAGWPKIAVGRMPAVPNITRIPSLLAVLSLSALLLWVPAQPDSADSAIAQAEAPSSLSRINHIIVFYQEQLQIDGGKMDGFVAWSDAAGLVMGLLRRHADARRPARARLHAGRQLFPRRVRRLVP